MFWATQTFGDTGQGQEMLGVFVWERSQCKHTVTQVEGARGRLGELFEGCFESKLCPLWFRSVSPSGMLLMRDRNPAPADRGALLRWRGVRGAQGPDARGRLPPSWLCLPGVAGRLASALPLRRAGRGQQLPAGTLGRNRTCPPCAR